MTTKARTTPSKPKAPEMAHLLEKDITPVMANYANWLKEVTGYDVDERTVQLAGTQRIVFQKSEMNRGDLASRKEAAAQAILDREARAEERAAKREEREKNAEANAAKRAEAKVAREEAKANKAASAVEGKAPAAKKPTAAAKKAAAAAPSPKRRRAATKADNEEF